MITRNRKIIIVYLLLFVPFFAFSQDDLMDMLDDVVEEEPMEVSYTFKSTRIINGHSIERMKSNQLDFRINHRFGEINQGAYDLWGLDQAKVSFDFGYGVNDWLMVGARRSTYDKTYDGSLKFTILRQTTGSKTIPVAVSYYTNMAYATLDDTVKYPTSQGRISYTHQLLVARKFSEEFSLQLSPSYVHRNLVNFDQENDIIALGIGGRYKFHRRVALMFEYFWTNNADGFTGEGATSYWPIAIGFDIETGGHVFQLFFTNAQIMEETGFLSETLGDLGNGGIYFGFNISRVFAVGKPKH